MNKEVEQALNTIKNEFDGIKIEELSSCDELDDRIEEYIRIGFKAGRESVFTDRRAARRAERERRIEELKNRKPLFERVMAKLGYQKVETPESEQTESQ